jgi:hypothetical protein
MGQVNFGLDAIRFGATLARRSRRTWTLSGRAEVRSNFVGFVVFQRTGMRLLLCDANFRQHIENGFAFYFQLPGQVVNSNLTHPPLFSSGVSR